MSSDASHPFGETWCSRLRVFQSTEVQCFPHWLLPQKDCPLHFGGCLGTSSASSSLVNSPLQAKPCARAFQSFQSDRSPKISHSVPFSECSSTTQLSGSYGTSSVFPAFSDASPYIFGATICSSLRMSQSEHNRVLHTFPVFFSKSIEFSFVYSFPRWTICSRFLLFVL